LEIELKTLLNEVWNLAKTSDSDCISLVTVLRELELIHRQIRQELLEPSLPDTRHDLYLLLKHIDEIGGWPYIERMKLQTICEKMLDTEKF
jgi:hypothetical protein